MSLRSHLGSGLATAAVFTVIASTGIQIGKLEPNSKTERPVYYLPPPMELAETRSTAPSTPLSIDAFPIETLVDPFLEELSLNPLDISLNAGISENLSLNLTLQRQFQAAAPDLGDFKDFIIFDRSEVDQPPTIRHAQHPAVPANLRGAEVEVVVFYYVDVDGRTANHSVLDSSSPNPQYGELAESSIKSWRFKPARKNGKAVPCWVQQTIKFNRGSASPFSL